MGHLNGSGTQKGPYDTVSRYTGTRCTHQVHVMCYGVRVTGTILHFTCVYMYVCMYVMYVYLYSNMWIQVYHFYFLYIIIFIFIFCYLYRYIVVAHSRYVYLRVLLVHTGNTIHIRVEHTGTYRYIT